MAPEPRINSNDLLGVRLVRTMNLKKLTEAEKQARAFLAKTKALRERTNNDDLVWLTGCAESGAVRRQSMDLTRALSDLRKPL